MSAQTHTSYRFSVEVRSLLAKLATLHGISRRAVLEMLVRKEARKEKLNAD